MSKGLPSYSFIMKKTTQLLLLLSGIFLITSIFVPIWRIDLDAPQYPEGLRLLIYSNKLDGAVDIINGLNHYIGMKTLHADDFIEFTVLPYIIGFFAISSILVALLKNKKALNFLFFAFVAFGVIAMIDFWRWEYDYGHNLDPHAAIIVPGMAYQPPLIGFKQLLNFGAYSVPDIGGILFILSGLFMLLGVWIERKKKININSTLKLIILAIGITSLTSCTNDKPVAINYNTDACDYCKMTIADARFACEFTTDKGKAFKFDDVSCLSAYVKEAASNEKNIKHFFVTNFLPNNNLTLSDSLHFIKSETISSPMNGGIAAFTNLDSANFYKEFFQAELLTWEDILTK